jgi:hypothetical protein
LEKVELFGKAVAALKKAAGEATAMVQRNHAANMLECVSKNVNCQSCWGKLLIFLLFFLIFLLNFGIRNKAFSH